jgi:hypothetical protein
MKRGSRTSPVSKTACPALPNERCASEFHRAWAAPAASVQ